MIKDLEIWQFALEKLEKNLPVTLLVVAESSGSSPGRQGFKLTVSENEICGSIGGGVMEISLVEFAKRRMKEGINDTELVEQIHRPNVPNSSGMICSGRQTVIVKPLTKHDLSVIKRIIDCLLNGEKNCFIQITEKRIQTAENERFPADNISFLFQKEQNNSFIYTENIGYKQNLYIIGSGHCALALSEIMSKLDFRITVFDDRPNLNTLEKNKFAHRIEVIESYEKIAGFVPAGEQNYVVVMTLGYKFDEIVIRRLFDKDFKYFGVLGSRAKMKTLLTALEKEGFDKQKLSRIRTPIGLPINSHTPEEIAVSIAAEIISVKNSVKN